MESSISLKDLEEINRFFFNLRMRVFRTKYYDSDLFKKAYYEHLDRVNHYFTDRPQDLLVMNISGGSGWNQLCSFLKHPVPQEPFPFENSNRELVSNLNQDIAARLLATHPENWLS